MYHLSHLVYSPVLKATLNNATAFDKGEAIKQLYMYYKESPSWLYFSLPMSNTTILSKRDKKDTCLNHLLGWLHRSFYICLFSISVHFLSIYSFIDRQIDR